MERDELPTAASVPSSEFAPRKLARQLDFKQYPAYPPARPVAEVQRAGIPLPVRKPVMAAASVKLESPRPQPQAAAVEVKVGTPETCKLCNCKSSRCLKLYCVCFASGVYCDGCNCLNCHNNANHETARQEAIGAVLERNSNAFRPKIASSPHGYRMGKQEAGSAQLAGKHNKGCNCKRSGCLKKYCECFQANILCSDNCKCVDCKNTEGSEERRALFYGSNCNTMVYQAANAAINGAIGASGYGSSPSTRKRKSQEPSFVGMYNNQHVYRNVQYTQQGNIQYATSSLQCDTISRGPDTQAASKVIYRSPLSGVIQQQAVKDLCSLLVIVSKEAAQAFTDKGSNIDDLRGNNEGETSGNIALQEVHTQKEASNEQGALKSNLTEEKAVGTCGGSSGVDESGWQNERPASPGTMALMCYEKDTVLMELDSPIKVTVSSKNTAPELTHDPNLADSYAEQERVVLTKFRDFLNRLITCGSIKETMCSSLTRSEPQAKVQPVIKDELFKDGHHMMNGIVKPLLPVVHHTPGRTAGGALGPTNGFTQNGMLQPKIEKAV